MEQAAGHLYLFVDGSYLEPAAGGGWFATDMARMAFGSHRLPNGLPNSETAEAYALHAAFKSAFDEFPHARSLTLMMDNMAVVDAIAGLRTAPSRYAHKIEAVIAIARERGVECEVAHVKAHQNKRDLPFACNAIVDRLANFGRLGHVVSHAEPFHMHSWFRRMREIDPELTVLSGTIGHVRAAEILRYPIDGVEAALRRYRVVKAEDHLYRTNSVLALANRMRHCGHWGPAYDAHLDAQAKARANAGWPAREGERPAQRQRGPERFSARAPALHQR